MSPVSRRAISHTVLIASLMIFAAIVAACAPVPAAQTSAPTQAAAATEAPAAPAATTAPTEPPATAAPAATDAPTVAPTEAPTATTEATTAPEPTAAPAATEATASAAPVSFSQDLMPLFEQKCVKCHGGSDGEKGDLNLTSHAKLMQGGEDGQVVMPGDAANSMLWKLVDEGKMPRRQPRLPQEQIDMIAAWINQGAQDN